MPTAHISFLTHLQYLTKSYHFHCDKKKKYIGVTMMGGRKSSRRRRKREEKKEKRALCHKHI